MANLPGPSSTTPYRPHKWLFDKQEMKQAKSIVEGYTEEKELEYRQRATRFIQEMVDRLNEQVKEKMNKVSQLCVCSASIHMHRFYYFHSFRMFDYRDIAAACLFLSGKSEESPRKLDSIVHVWWGMKFPKHPRFTNNNHFTEARQLIVQLENVILQTIAFDLKIDLPHPVVLSLTKHNIGQVANDHGNKRLTECAYFFATDVLCVTNWAIRYSAAEIAVCCVNIVSIWSQHEIPNPGPGPWYIHAACNMTGEKLEEMTDEFLRIYDRCKGRLALTKFVSKGQIKPPNSCGSDESSGRSPNYLPPPPPPPQINRDPNDHKDRQPRKSFIPDTSQLSKPVSLLPLHLPGMGNPPPAMPMVQARRIRPDERQHRDEEQRRKEKEKRREERRREERPEDRERRKEEERKRKDEERRKRDHERISGHQGEHHHGHKKPRTEGMMQQFVPASNDIFNGVGKDRLSLPSMKLEAPVSPLRAPPSLSRFGVPPPPLPPSMKLSPPPLPPKNDLEEGEVE